MTPEEEIEAALWSDPHFVELASDSLLRSIQIILQDKHMDEVCSNVKAAIGSILEQYFLPYMQLPKNPRGIDTEIAGHPVDIKHSVGTSWMVGEEGFGHLCLLFQTNYNANQFSIGIIRADLAYLGKGKNKDSKKSFTKKGQAAIRWIVRHEPFRELIALPSAKEIADLQGQLRSALADNVILREENYALRAAVNALEKIETH